MYVNEKSVKQPAYAIQATDLVDGSVLPVRMGKRTRKFALFESPLCSTCSTNTPLTLAPLSRVLEHLQPGRHGALPLLRPVGPLVLHEQTLGVRHHAQVAAVGRGQTHHGTLGAVRVHRKLYHHVVVVVHVLQRHAVLAHRLLLHHVIGPEAAALAVRHPHAQRGALHALQHDRVRLLHAHVHEARLQLLVEQGLSPPTRAPTPARRCSSTHPRLEALLSSFISQITVFYPW